MRWLRRHLRCIAALFSSYVLGSSAFLHLLRIVNQRLLGGRIATVFMFYPATQAYADAVCYRWHQRRFSWRPGLIGVFVQNGRIGLNFAIPNTENDFKDECNVANVVALMHRLDSIRIAVGAAHKTFAGILPSILTGLGVEDRDIAVQRNLTARTVLAAIDWVISKQRLAATTPVLVLGARGYVATEFLRLAGERPLLAIDVGEMATFRDFARRRRGYPLLVVNLTKKGALSEYLCYFWPGVTVLNEVYPEPSLHELRALESLGANCYHIAGIRAVVWPPFPSAYRGGIPCCASLPLRDDEPVEVVIVPLASATAAKHQAGRGMSSNRPRSTAPIRLVE